MKRHFLIFIFFAFSIFCRSQNDMSEIIQMHKDNMRDLSSSRGIIPEWDIPSDFNENHLSFALKYFYTHKKIGILIYTHEKDTLIVNLIDKNGVKKHVKTPIIKAEFEKLVSSTNSYIKQLKYSKTNKNDLRGTDTSSESNLNNYQKLNRIILPKDFIINEFEHIIIVPTLNIGTLPFAALKLNSSNYLIDKMSYSISPSIFEIYSTLKTITRHRFNADYFNFKKPLLIYKTNFNKSKFSNLKHTKSEVLEVASTLSNSRIISNENATKKYIKSHASDIDLIYFATHGSSDNKNPLDKSFLVLSDENNYDDFLTAREIQSNFFYNYDSYQDKKMAVLSACNTGLGKSHSGGTIGLARAFQIAGFNHVLMSLWSVSDYETAKFMTIFFNELTKSNNSNLDPHNSLQKAINRFRKEVSNSPKHWASFSMFGVPNPDSGSYSNTNSELNFLFQEPLRKKESNINSVKDKIKLNLKNPDYKFSFKLIPVRKIDSIEKLEILKVDFNSRFDRLLIKDNTQVVLEVFNEGTKPIYFNIIEINSEGESYPLLPSDYCSYNNVETQIEPGERVLFRECILEFSPPYEKYTIKGFGTKTPINLDFKSRVNTIYNNEVEGYTSEIIYEIVKE